MYTGTCDKSVNFALDLYTRTCDESVNIELDVYTGTYDKLLLAGDLNTTGTEFVLDEFLYVNDLKCIVNDKTCFKNPENPAVLIFSSPISLVASIIPFDLTSLCETSLNDSVELPETLLNNYTFVPVNSPANTRHWGVGLFFKNTLPIIIRNDLPFDESIVVELKFGRKKCFFTVLYRSSAFNHNSYLLK